MLNYNCSINVPLILIVREVIFYAGKTHNRRFRGVFRGGQDFFDPQIVLSAVQYVGHGYIKKIATHFERLGKSCVSLLGVTTGIPNYIYLHFNRCRSSILITHDTSVMCNT